MSFLSRRRLSVLATVAVMSASGGLELLAASPAQAAGTTFNVTTTADIAANAGACGNTGITTPPSPSSLSLREATCLANNVHGTVTINIPAGHYTLTSGELQLSKVAGDNASLVGAGAGATIVDGANSSRVLELDPGIVGGVTNSISGLTITGGADSGFGGAGIIAGSGTALAADVLDLANVVITGNHANGATPTATNKPGGGVQFIGGKLTITNSTISSNSAGSSEGSGVYYDARGTASPESLTITGSTFSGNSDANAAATVPEGGALSLRGQATTPLTVTNTRFVNNSVTSTSGSGPAVGGAIWQQGGQLTVTGSTFTGNSVSGAGGATGGAIEVSGGSVTLHYNRLTGNTATTGSALHNTSGTVDAAENWWGCNTGPGTAGCDTTAGTVTSAPRLVLTATASPSHVVGPNGTATITAALTTDSLGAAVGSANLVGAFDTLPVTFADPPGDATVTSTAGAHSVAMSSGTASIDYHSNTVLGPDNDSVTLDNGTATAVLEVDEPPAITSANAAHFNIGSAGSFTVTTTGYPNAALSETGTLPTGLTFTDNGNGTATISGTATGSGGSFPINLTANNGYSPNATQTLTITVGQPPAFTSASTATFSIGSAGSFTVTTSGIPTVSTITESGTLPAGITFTDNGNGTATISGTPTGTGNTYPVTLTATNGVSPNGTQSLSIQVNQSPAVTLNPSDQTVSPGTSVTFSAAASGVPTPTVQWQRSTDGGASFTNIAGATSTSYTFSTTSSDDGNQYRAVFTNVAGTATTTAATLSVGTAPSFTSADNTTFVVGQAGSFSITTTGVPSATLSRTGAQFPAWLTLTDNGDGTGSLSGTPPAGSSGSYSFVLKAANGFSPSASQNFTLFVDDSPVITSADHTTFTVGSAGSFAVTTTAGYPTATSLSKTGSLPSGVTFTDNGDGTATLSGTPAAGTGGVYAITLRATATGGLAPDAVQSFTLTVTEPPTITSADHATFAVGSAGSFTVTTAAGYPTATTLSKTGSLPTGVTFTDNGDGTATLAGTPAAGTGGVYSLTLKASNGISPDATQSFTLTVNEPPHLTSADHATFTRGSAGSFTVTTAGGQPAAVTITESGALPSGMIFTDNGDGTATLAGTPTVGGTYPFTITASNGVLPNATQSFTATVDAVPTITSADHTTFAVGTAGSFTVTTTAGYPVATTLTKTGSLPSGVTFTDNGDGTATLAGTPAAGTGGTYPLTVTADNGVSSGSTQSFTLTVIEPPHLTSADHTTFAVGTAGSFTVTTTAGYPAATTVTETGSLPSGVSFTDNGDGTATLAGTPAAGTGGSYPLTVTASNGVLPNSTQSFTLTVTEPPHVTSADHTSFAVGSAGSFTVTTTPGAPAATTLTYSGVLPTGVSFTDNGDGTATLAGTPAAGTGSTYPLTITASNGVLPNTTQSFTLTVDEPAAFTSADHTSLSVGVPGGFTVTTSAGYPLLRTVTSSGALPAGITVVDNGDGTATIGGTPAAGSAGSYPLTLTVDNGFAQTHQAFVLAVGRQTQTITDTSTAPTQAVVGSAYQLVATSDSHLPVTFSVDPATTGSACSISGSTVTFTHAGTCVIDDNQAGDGTYAAAPQVQHVTTVATRGSTLALVSSATPSSYGAPVTMTATVATAGTAPHGTVQFGVDGTAFGSPVPVTSDGKASSAPLTDAAGQPLAPGAHSITAQFTPSDPTTDGPANGTVTQVVDKGATTTAVSVHSDSITADVAPVAPAAGSPTGTVTFTIGGNAVGTATLTGGTATLSYQVPGDDALQVAAIYAGDQDFTGSSDSTTRHNPTITAVLSSAHPKTRYGWYRSSVTVTFHCAVGGAALVAPCPAPVQLTGNGAAQSLTRTISATDGGVATVVVSGINIDTVAPTVSVSGVRNKATYVGTAPKARCVGHDALSGIASCVLTTHRSGATTSYRAVATDKAGNTRTVTGSYRTLGIYVAGARYSHGAFIVTPGHTYTIVVAGTAVRPVYYDAAPLPVQPTKRDKALHAAGVHRWAVGVTMETRLRSHKRWNLGIKIGHVMRLVVVQISGSSG